MEPLPDSPPADPEGICDLRLTVTELGQVEVPPAPRVEPLVGSAEVFLKDFITHIAILRHETRVAAPVADADESEGESIKIAYGRRVKNLHMQFFRTCSPPIPINRVSRTTCPIFERGGWFFWHLGNAVLDR